MRSVDNGVGNTALKSREADIQPCLKEISIASRAKVDFGIDGQIGRKRDLHFPCGEAHRPFETG
jgi:hypothetical protein